MLFVAYKGWEVFQIAKQPGGLALVQKASPCRIAPLWGIRYFVAQSQGLGTVVDLLPCPSL